MKTILFIILALIFASPPFIGLVDIFTYFFTGHQASSIDWEIGRVQFALITTIPAYGFLLFADY